MSDSVSVERPRTPPRSSEIASAQVQQEKQQPEKTPAHFSYVSELIYPIKDAQSSVKWHIPPAYRESEAVDSSVLLGRGASFSASLQRIPAGPDRTEQFTDMGGWTVNSSKPAAPRPRSVVYKTTRIAFSKDGRVLPEYQRALRSVLTEFHALIYPPLMKQQNIIDFIGFGWGSNPFSPAHKLPAIILEYAEHGTLASLLAKNPDLSATQRQFLALDVAQGLSALHQTGLVHGDVKADNVLICSHPDRQYIAKIADFGFSVVPETEDDHIYMGGTRPWMAPEVLKGPVTLPDLPQTDIFSFGLLCWVIYLGGDSPLKYLESQESSAVSYFERIKADGSLLGISLADRWLDSLAHEKFDQKIERALDASIEKIKNMPTKSGLNADQMQRNRPLLRARMLSQMSLPLKNSFLKHLSKVFESSLQLLPQERKLKAIVAELREGLPSFEGADDRAANSTEATSQPLYSESQNQLSQNVSLGTTGKDDSDVAFASPLTWDEQGFMHNWLSWQKMKELEPAVQKFVCGALQEDRATNLFVLSALHMLGYGCPKSTERSLEYLQRATEMGSTDARSYQFRINSALLQSPLETNFRKMPGGEYLYDYAANGSRMAMAELRRVASKEEAKKCWDWASGVGGGVGATWFDKDQMFGLTQAQWFEYDFSIKNIEQKGPHVVVNKRGDTILHFAAMCGRLQTFKALIETYKVDINLRNALGETPTLAACRAGHGGIVIWCLQRYKGDPSLAAHNGETPLHWLCQFDDQYIESMAADMMARGAKIDAATRQKVMHSRFPGTIDMDYMLPGTPLHWAVHQNRPHIVRILLKHGANPISIAPGAIFCPLDWAAYWHHHECLRIIIEHQEGNVMVITTEGKKDLRHAVMYGPLVQRAIRAADKFSMILRHGIEWRQALYKTLDLLREKTVMINFSSRFDGSALYFAVSGAHDEVVEYMFEHNWLVDTINKPIGDAQRTPLLEAVRWNRRPLCDLLWDKGADVKALATNPFEPSKKNWSALHILAHEGHDNDISLVEWLIKNGVPVDGRRGTHNNPTVDTAAISTLVLDDLKAGIYSCETAFTVAVRRNAFNLANELLRLGANPNTLAFSSGMFISSHPLTILGHTIISNARYYTHRLRYLLGLSDNKAVDFIVEPERRLTALHRAALANIDVSRADDSKEAVKKEDFDFETNAEIMSELLVKWRKPVELNEKCLLRGDTALHLAVRSGNVGTVEALLQAGADKSIANNEGIIPEILVRTLYGKGQCPKSIVWAFKGTLS